MVTDPTMVVLVSAILVGVVVIAAILVVGNNILSDFRRRQVESQERTARVGEESLRVIREEAAGTPAPATPTPTAQNGRARPTTPVAGAGEAAVGPALVAHQRESQQAAVLRAENEQLRAQLQRQEEDPILTICQGRWERTRRKARVLGAKLGVVEGEIDNQEVELELIRKGRVRNRNQNRIDRQWEEFYDLEELEELRPTPPPSEGRRPTQPPRQEAPIQEAPAEEPESAPPAEPEEAVEEVDAVLAEARRIAGETTEEEEESE